MVIWPVYPQNSRLIYLSKYTLIYESTRYLLFNIFYNDNRIPSMLACHFNTFVENLFGFI